ncbi:phage tail protein [Vibrio sp. CyArs1]|uniref:phage tail-collar fiber domain-containing protein n=1 Tax=Vibrio sp. CyArs1 TaxID=2682577 RepID=UPI001F06B75C|nr:phage tail protein [Vibrio sp. CyArs1]
MTNTTDKSILTAAGKALLAQLNAEEKALVIDKMIFANVPNRPEFPQPDDVVPSDDVVHEAAVEQRGRLSVDSVIYSTTLTSQEGPFEFNWTGAYCSEYGVLVTIDHHALTPKTVDEPGVSGNTLVRSVVLEYKDIAEITNITVDASTWQYNATPRMKKMDDDVAQSIIDQNGKDWFIEDGFLVTPQASAFNIKSGAGYVSGNRVTLEFDRNVQVPNKPSFIYVDAHREGTPTGEQVTLFDFVVTADDKDDYADANGVKHFVCKIAQVLGDGSVSDLRQKSLANLRWEKGKKVTSHRDKFIYFGVDAEADGKEWYAPEASQAEPKVMGDTPIADPNFREWKPEFKIESLDDAKIAYNVCGTTIITSERIKGSERGGAEYEVKTISSYFESTGLLEPDGFADHIDAGGNVLTLKRKTGNHDLYVFGGISDGTDDVHTDNTPMYDAYCQWLYRKGGGSLFLPDGDFAMSVLTRRSKISVYGAGQRATNIHPIARDGLSIDPVIGLIEVDSGPVQFSNLRNMTLWASREQDDGLSPVNPDQWAMYHRAKWDSDYNHGGLWSSITENIDGKNWLYGVWSRGGYTTAHSLLPNQWNTYKDVNMPAEIVPWRFTGQHGQTSVKKGKGDGPGISEDVTCVTIDWDPEPSQVASEQRGESSSDIAGVGNAVRAPVNVSFREGFSTQQAKKAYFVRSGVAISIDDCWVENTQEAIECSVNGEVSVENTNFANAGDGEGSGYILKHGNNSYIMWGEGNNVGGKYDKFAEQINLSRGYSYKGGMGKDISGEILSGYLQVSEDAGVVDVKEHPYVIMNSGNLNSIKSGLLPGSLICIRAIGGAVVVGSSGNISIAGSTVTIPKDEAALFMRTPGPKTWQLVTV